MALLAFICTLFVSMVIIGPNPDTYSKYIRMLSDINNDKVVTREEYMQLYIKVFNKMDLNKDNKLSQEEFDKIMEALIKVARDKRIK